MTESAKSDKNINTPAYTDIMAEYISNDMKQSTEHYSTLKENKQHNSQNSKAAKKNFSNLQRYTLVALFLAASVSFFSIVKIFIVPLLVASTLVALLYPLYKKLLVRIGNNRVITSLILCAGLTLCLLTPVYMIVHTVTRNAVGFLTSSNSSTKEILNKIRDGIPVKYLQNPVVQSIISNSSTWQSTIQSSLKSLTVTGTRIFNKTSASVLEFLVTIITIIFIMFYLFMDGEKLVKKIRSLSNLKPEYEEMIIQRFLLISRATVKGTLIIGLIQGTLGALTLLIFGIGSWFFWGLAMIMLAMIPLMGTWIVLIPAGIIQLISGNTWQGTGIILCSVLIISQIDNIIRPRLVGQEAKMHDLFIFFSVLGGIFAFGPLGFIVGPVIAAFFVAVTEIYAKEFEEQLSERD